MRDFFEDSWGGTGIGFISLQNGHGLRLREWNERNGWQEMEIRDKREEHCNFEL